jgi:uncharacterized membrane protein
VRLYASPLLIAVAWIWVALLLAAPLAAAGVPLSAATYAFGSLICHQQHTRSLHLGGAQLPVCARCTGLYAGAAFGVLLFPLLRAERLCPAGVTMSRLRLVLIASAIPTAASWGLEAAGLAHPSNVARLIAALPLGAVVGAVVLATAAGRLR